MNKLQRNDKVGYDSEKDLHDWYFDIQDLKRPLFTPVIFGLEDSSANLTVENYFRNRYHKTTSSLIGYLFNGYRVMHEYRLKTVKYYVGRGIIMRIQEDLATGECEYKPLIIFCFDENTDFTAQKGYTIIVSPEEINSPVNKPLKSKIMTILSQYEKNSQIIFTNDVKKWCFNTVDKLKFKSIREQSEFLSNLVDTTLKEHKLVTTTEEEEDD